MKKKQKQQRQLFQDSVLLLFSIAAAIFLARSGALPLFISSLHEFSLLGVVFAGMFFTSIFTTAPSIALLSAFAKNMPAFELAVLGGLGAVIGDSIIFIFIRDRVSEDVAFLLSHSKIRRIPAIFKTRLFKFFVPLLGALIIASPFPDEIGVAMLGLSNVKKRTFFLVSFVFNSIGIGVIALLVQTLG